MSITDTTNPTVDNGVNVEALLGAREAFGETPAAAQFVWRGSAKWAGGVHTATSFDSFFGLGADQPHRQEYTIDTDHPEQFAATDNGVTPTEIVLAGLAGCLTAGIATVATNRGVQLRSVTATVEADMDLQGVMGVDPDVRNGFSGVRVSYEIDADASEQELEGIVAQSQKRSAIYDVFTNPTNVSVSLVSA